MANRQSLGREAFTSVLDAVGSGAFSGQVVDYLRTYLAIEQAIIAIVPRDGARPVDILFHNAADAEACQLYLDYLRHCCPPLDDIVQDDTIVVLDDARSDPHGRFAASLRAFLGLGAELRLALQQDETCKAMMILCKPAWNEAETGLAIRCAGFLRPTVLAHAKFRADQSASEGDWRLERVRKAIGADRLTSREFDVVMLILAGDSTQTISRKLDISGATVKVHRRHAYAKLNISCQAELFALAFRDIAF